MDLLTRPQNSKFTHSPLPMQNIITKAKELALSEIKLYGTPKTEHFELSNQK
ncbi:hypothetical protein KKG31_05795 [Patescibacteria group bacterium]|nr:hypothetical protein [Patescibacteria group bacterium]